MAMAKVIGDAEIAQSDYKAVFIDTNLDTHLAIPLSYDDTVFDLKRKLLSEHSKCFVKFGEIEIHYLKVRRKGKFYFLSDLMPVRSVFGQNADSWFLSAEISTQSGRYEAVDNNTGCNPDPRIQMLPCTSRDSSLRKGFEKDERNARTGNPSGEARSENLQLVADFDIDDNVKSSSSDTMKRLNVLVEDIYKASREEEVVPMLLSGREGLNSNGLLTEVMSVNPSGTSSDVVSAENITPKKKRKVADKDSASKKLEVMENVDTGAGSAGVNKQEDECFGINRNGAELEKTEDPHGVGSKNLESHERDTQDVTIKSDTTKGTGTPKKKKKRITKVEAVNGETFSDIDASVNVSAKFLDMPIDAVPLLEGSKDMSMHVQSNDSNVDDPINMVKDGTGELEGLKSIPSKSGMRKSKKRKNNGDDVSHQMDSKGNEELGVHDIESGKVPELGMTRPLKRKKTGDDLLDVTKMDGAGDDKPSKLNSKQKNVLQKSKKKTKLKQTPALKSTDLTGIQMDTMETEKSKFTFSELAAEKDDSINTESLSPPHKNQIDKLVVEATFEADIETANIHVDGVLITNHPSDIKTQPGANEAIHNDPELMQLTQTQKSEDAEIKNKRSSKKINKKSNLVAKIISELPAVDENNSMKCTESKSACSKVTPEKNDEMELPSSCQGQIDKAVSVADSNADIVEVRNADGGVGDKVIAPAEFQVPLKAAKSKGSEKTSSESKHLRKSTDVVQQPGSKDSVSAKRNNAAADSIKSKDEGSNLIGQSADVEQYAAIDTLKSKVDSNISDSRTSSSHSDTLSKRSHQVKIVKELPKTQNFKPSLPRSAKKSTIKAVHNPQSEKRSLISSTDSSYDDQNSSDYSDDESRGSWVSPKRGNSLNAGDASQSKSIVKNLSMESILRSSQKFKKAKLVASKLKLLDEES